MDSGDSGNLGFWGESDGSFSGTESLTPGKSGLVEMKKLENRKKFKKQIEVKNLYPFAYVFLRNQEFPAFFFFFNFRTS